MRALELATLVTTGLLVGCGVDETIRYPESRRTDHIDVYHGVEVADPYRWLEEDVRDSKEVAEWVRRQNELTLSYLSKIPGRDQIEARIRELWNFERHSSFSKAANRYFFLKNDGLQSLPVLWVQDALDAQPRVLLDPNTWSDDGTLSLDRWHVSPDGRHLAYAVNEGGSDWQTYRVAEIETGRVLDDEILWSRLSAVSWDREGRGFFYLRYPAVQNTYKLQSVYANQKLYYHAIETEQEQDVLIYADPDNPGRRLGIYSTSEGRYHLVHSFLGAVIRSWWYLDSDRLDQGLKPLTPATEQRHWFIDAVGPLFYFTSDQDAPRGRVIAIDIRRPQPENWRVIIPESPNTLVDVSIVGDRIIAQYLVDAAPQVKLFSLDGELVGDVELPGSGDVGGFDGALGDEEAFFRFSNYVTPPTTYRLDIPSGESRKVMEAGALFDSADYVIERVFYESTGGARIPMYLTYRTGLERDGGNPTLLHAYGGFGATIRLGFSSEFMTWLDLGGVLAVAGVRGGGEYGAAWHDAGRKANKQNVFDDFIAGAEWLIENGYTRKEKLAIYGTSNGGLLIGAVLTQRPDLFGAAVADAGIMDMLRYHRFSAGVFWVGEFGLVDDPNDFRTLSAYSPYHNLSRHSNYPPTLITTADTDDRVVPLHSFKFAAEMQHRQTRDAPILLRVESSAGHGGGTTPTGMRILELADRWAFVVRHLGMELQPAGP